MSTRSWVTAWIVLVIVTGGCPHKSSTPVKDTAAPATPATLATGIPTLGCFAWSATERSAACVEGVYGVANVPVELRLAFRGHEQAEGLELLVADNAMPPEMELDQAITTSANQALAHGNYLRFDGAAEALTSGESTELAGVSIVWTRKETFAGGDNQAPQYFHSITARCDGQDLDLFDSDSYDGSASVRTVDGHVIIELAIDIADEGMYGSELYAIVIDGSSCTVF